MSRTDLDPFVFDEHDDINIDGAIARFVSQLLVHQADQAHGSPVDYRSECEGWFLIPGDADPGFTGWVFDMRLAAYALDRYKLRHDIFGARSDALYNDAKAAMRWVADNLDHLWD